jgi:hypothetical protein
MIGVVSLVLAILLGLAAPVGADEIVKHSGSIVSIAGDVKSFVLAEVGPWQVRDGSIVITYRTIALTPETEYAIVGRADEPPSGFPSDFVEIPIGPDEVYLNDYATIDCRHEGKRLVALKITVIEVPLKGRE